MHVQYIENDYHLHNCRSLLNVLITQLKVAYLTKIELNKNVLQINPKKFKPIKNKSIPNPLRPKFRKKAQANIYFLSQRKITGEKKDRLVKNLKYISILSILLVGGYLLSN